MKNFDLDSTGREQLFRHVGLRLNDYYQNTQKLDVSKGWQVEEVREYATSLSVENGNSAQQTLDFVMNGLENYAVQTPHPSYYGLFNPRTAFASILADLITATYNPQMAAWSHAPFANEIERFVIREFGKKLGYKETDGNFCSGGAEANLTALIAALHKHFPGFAEEGVKGIEGQPLIYFSSESHHSIAKAARMTGLGSRCLRSIPANHELSMDLESLRNQIAEDRSKGAIPFMLIGTAGTTGAGVIDDLEALSDVATEENLWFHVDAAYGGAAIVSEKYGAALAGIEKSDSITLDLHKWFSVPMGTSLFLTSDKRILGQSFRIQTAYMPEDGDPNEIVDPYTHSVQWSRRFNGLKIFLPLAIHGWKAYEKMINQQIENSQLLREMLVNGGWEVLNKTILPVLCFHDPREEVNMQALIDRVNLSGNAWVSLYPLNGIDTARVCLTNYATDHDDLRALIDLFNGLKN